MPATVGIAQRAHARQREIAKRQPADKVPQAVYRIGLKFSHMLKACFQSIRIAVDVAEKASAHEILKPYSSIVSKVPSSFCTIFILRPLGSVNLIVPP